MSLLADRWRHRFQLRCCHRSAALLPAAAQHSKQGADRKDPLEGTHAAAQARLQDLPAAAAREARGELSCLLWVGISTKVSTSTEQPHEV